MPIEDFIPEHIRALSAYVPGKPVRQAERESGVRCIKLASNENPFGPSPQAVAAISGAASVTNFYPDNEATELRSLLAEKHAVKPQQILVTDGSTALLDMLARMLLAPGLNAVTSERSFIVYSIVTRLCGAKLVQAPMSAYTFDLEALARAIDGSTRLVFIANPNNPTGTMFFANELERFLSRVPDHVMIVLDEAYYDYGEYHARKMGRTYSRSMQYVAEGRKNVIVLRTFSKAHGLAGLRVGYGIADAQIVSYLSQIRTAFSVSVPAEAGAIAAVKDEAHIRMAVERNAEGVAFLFPRLQEMGFRVVPTTANFLYIESAEDANALAARIQEGGCIVRSLVAWGIPNALRITVGTPEQNRILIDAISKALKTKRQFANPR